MNAPERQKRLQLRIDIILTVLFLFIIFAMGILTVATDFDGIYKADTRISQLQAYLDEDWQDAPIWNQISARIRSLDNYLGQNVFAATELGYLNSSFQYGIGKQLINTGASQMLTLNSGHLFDLQNYVPMDSAAENIRQMAETVPADVPFLFVYEHPTIYSSTQMSEGYAVLDYSDEIAAEIEEKIGAMNIPMMDSRQVLPDTGLALEDYLMYTDQHWATRASLEMAKAIAARASEMTGIDLQPELLDISQFETETYPQLFLGKYGQRIGPGNIDPDDITLYWPKYETQLSRHTNYLGEISDVQGSFRDVAIRWKYLQPDPGKTWNIKAYFDYGLTENYDIYSNPSAPDCTILLLKDSYSASIGSFLSLAANQVYAVDLRRSELSLAEWIDESQPDIVIVAYSMQMLRDDAYEFQ